MTDLQRFDKEGIELVINTQTGESFATISGYARMALKTQQAISLRVNKLESTSDLKVTEAQILTTTGLKTHKLIDGKLARKWLIKDNPELAEEMIEVGWTVYCHQKAGFKITSTAIELKPKTALELAREQVALLEKIERNELKILLQKAELEAQEKVITTQSQTLEEQKPKVDFYEAVRESETNVTFDIFAKIISNKLKNKMEAIGGVRLFEIMRQHGFLMEKPKAKKNVPYQRFITQGIFKVIQKNNRKNNNSLYTQTVITPKGQQYLVKWFNETYAPNVVSISDFRGIPRSEMTVFEMREEAISLGFVKDN
jgi:phage antirepressor YoqD-like protein